MHDGLDASHESFFFLTDVATRRFSVGHINRDTGPQVARPLALARNGNPAGGIWSSVADVLRYARFHMGDGRAEDGAVVLPYTQAKQALDRLKKLCIGRDLPDATATARFDKATRNGEDMVAVQKQLAAAVAAITGKKEERAVASLFTPGGTHAMKGEFAGINDFEVVAYLVVLPDLDS